MRKRSQWRVGGSEWCALVTFAVAGSFLFGGALVAARITSAQKQAHRANELTLAGVRPGRDTYATARRRLGKSLPLPTLVADDEIPGQASWAETCARRMLTLEMAPSGVIQTVTLASDRGLTFGCNTPEPNRWATGHGIRLGDLQSRVISIYGKPGSVSPGTKNGRELELLYYAFDWAGPDVPQVMEITCEKATGRVVEILLAFPSL